MSIGNRKDEGSKGNNFTWQSKVLKGLQKIVETNGSGGGGGDATEATQLNVLSQLELGTTSVTTLATAQITVVTLQAANPNRKSVKITNDGGKVLYVKEGSGATALDYTWRITGGEMAIIDDYNGILTGIWSAAVGVCLVTETT